MQKSIICVGLVLLMGCGRNETTSSVPPPAAATPPGTTTVHVTRREVLPPITNAIPEKYGIIDDLTGKTTVDMGRRAAQKAREAAAKHDAQVNDELQEP